MDRAGKESVVRDLSARIGAAAAVVVSHYSGLSVKQMSELRREMRAAGAEVQVVKNRLTRIAVKGTPYTNIDSLLTGPTAVAFSKDPVAAAKVAHTFALKNEKFIILGGAMGEKRLVANEVKALATLPSLDELRGKLVGLLVAPATKLAVLNKEPAASVARVIAAKSRA